MWNRFCIDSGKLKMRTIRVADIWLVNSIRAENWWKFPCHSTITMCKWINVFIILFQSANRWTFEWAWCRLNVCRKNRHPIHHQTYKWKPLLASGNILHLIPKFIKRCLWSSTIGFVRQFEFPIQNLQF